jgi:predicted transcriptional regulator
VKEMENYAYIVLNFEKFWKRLCSQNRAGKSAHAFVRRGIMGPKKAKHLFFYVTYPRKEIRGYADFVERISGNAKDLWQSLGHESLLNSYEEYNDFLQGRRKATFIRFSNLKELPNPIKPETFAQIIGKKRMPQQGMYITEEMAQQLLSAGGVATIDQ